jgi:hypothetical protein
MREQFVHLCTGFELYCCDPLALRTPWQGSYFGHAFSKTCQYATNDVILYYGFQEVNLKATQSALHKTITWMKKSGKGRSKWKQTCFNIGLSHQKLKTPVKTRFASEVILFQETLKYQDAINLCYEKQETVELQSHVPNWATSRQQNVSLYAKLFHWILSEFTGCSEWGLMNCTHIL